MTVDRLMLWNTEEVLRPSAGVSQGGGKKTTEDRQKTHWCQHVFLSPESLLNFLYVAGGHFCCHILNKATCHSHIRGKWSHWVWGLMATLSQNAPQPERNAAMSDTLTHRCLLCGLTLHGAPWLPYTPCYSPSYCALHLDVFHFIFQTSSWFDTHTPVSWNECCLFVFTTSCVG